MKHSSHWLIAALVGLLVSLIAGACERPVSSEPSSDPASSATESEPALTDAVGETSREWIVEHHPTWAPEDAAAPDRAVAKKLSQVPAGATVDVYLGTWCSDSRREVPRFWRALKLAGEVPFQVNYVGLDRSFEAGDVDLSRVGVEAVPTFVVKRDGEEVGRVVEKSPQEIEKHLLDLLTGEASGKISATR